MNMLRTSRDLSVALKALRAQRGLSQAELGSRIGLSQERISAIESAPQRIPLQQLMKVLMALEAELSLHARDTSAPKSSGRSW